MSYVDGRQADLAHVHRRGGRGGECRQLPARAMLPSQGAWVAPAEPPASGEAQRAYGEERRKGAAQHAVHCRWVSVRGGPTAGAGAQSGAARGKEEQCVATPATSPRDTPSAHASVRHSNVKSRVSVRASMP